MFLQGITDPDNWEVIQSPIFLTQKYIQPAEIYCQIFEVYGEGVMSEENVGK